MNDEHVPDAPSEFSRLRRFTAVGLVNTAVDLAVFSLLRIGLAWPLLLANSIAFSCAMTCGFLLNRHWTFVDRRHHRAPARQYVMFLALAFGGLTLSNSVVWWLSHSIPDIVSKLVSFVFIFVWNYSTSRLVVFRRRVGAEV